MKSCLLWLLIAASSLGVSPARAEVVAEKIAAGAYPDLAADAAGNVHLVYVRGGKLRYRQRDAQTKQWSAEQDPGLPQGMVHRSPPAVVVDSQNRPHVLVGSSYAWRDGQTWRSVALNVVRDTGLAINSNDDVYVVRRQGHQDGYLGLLVRRNGAAAFEPLPDPDVAGGLPRGQNDHVYGQIAVHPTDGSLHIVYRHGSPTKCAYRVSTDGGRTWAGAGVSDDDREAPSITIGPDGGIYVVSGTGVVHRRGTGPDEWNSLGRGLNAGSRDRPVLAIDAAGRIFAACFGGRIGVYADGRWSRQTTLPQLSRQPLGFVALSASPEGRNIYAAWEEGSAVHNHDPAGESAIVFAPLDAAAVAALVAADSNAADRLNAEDRKPTAPPRQVGQWSRFEAGVINPKDYRDSYRDVALDVEYKRPDGSTVKFWGFYDGGRLWTLRFMPDRLGRWSYTSKFSDGSPGISGEFECVASDLPGMIDRDETNPMWFGFRGGRHGLVRAFHVGDRFFAGNWPESERAQFLDWAGRQGYNTLSIASHYLKREARDRGADWDIPRLWPPNAAEYRRMERILDDLAERRIMVFPFAGFFGRLSNFPTDPADQEFYVRYTLARIGSYWNVLLNVGGPEPHLRNHRYLADEEIDRLGRLIRDNDVFQHPLTVHNPTGDDHFRDADWLTYGTLQGPKTSDLSRLSRGLLSNHHREKPLLAQETLWSGNVNHVRALGGRDYTDEELRRNAWVIHLSAAALVFADNGGGNSSAGFSGSLDPSQAEQRRHDILKQVWNLAEQFPYYRMTPRQDLVDAGFCLAEPGRHYLVYLPERGSVTVKVEGGPFKVEWIDAQDGAKRTGGGSTRDGSKLSPPAGGSGEWLLWLVKEDR